MSEDRIGCRVGYVGLGNQGAPMATRLAEWPGGLVVFDMRAEAMAPFAELGATVASSIAEVAQADVISVTVLNDEQVRDVVGQLADHAKPGTVIAIHSTIEPNTALELAEQLQPKGISIVDAPVSGGAGAASKGELAVMVGADD
ncbi:NAD(P)-binding domain-containing protein, partial [Mycolicibacterium sp. CBMA 361]